MKRSVLSFGAMGSRFMVLLGVPVMLSSPAIAGVQDIRLMEQQNNGTFRVVCTNQQVEIVNSNRIINDQVCSPFQQDTWSRDRYQQRDWNNSNNWNNRDRDQGRDLLACKGNSSFDSVYLTRLSDGRQLGGSLTTSQCKRALDASRRGLVCTGSYLIDSVAVTRVSNGQLLSQNTSFTQCQEQIRSNNY